MMEQDDNANERPSSAITTEPVTNENMTETPGGIDQAKKTSRLLSHSPLTTGHRRKTFGSPIPANFASFEISPYAQTPGYHPPHGFSPYPSAWQLPPAPGVVAHHPYAYPFYPHFAMQPPHGDYARSSRSMTELGKSTRSDHPTEHEGKKPLQYQPHQGYYPRYPYPPPSCLHHPLKSPGAPLVSARPPPQHTWDHQHAGGGPDAYSYVPPSESRSRPVTNVDAKNDGNERNALNDERTATFPVDGSQSVQTHSYARNVTEETEQRRERKNALSRANAQRQREQIELIRTKPEWERTEEESQLLFKFDNRRGRKNTRSRERATETKEAVDGILQKPEERRTAIEVQFLRAQLHKKSRKNESDRMRRERLKVLGLTPKTKSPHIRVTARGPLPVEIMSASFTRASDPAYAYPYSPAVYGYFHHPIPPTPRSFSPFSASGGTSFTMANGKASVECPAEQP